MNFTFTDISNLTIPNGYPGKTVITTELLQDICTKMDTQAFHVAIAGFILSLFTMAYYGRIRPWIIKQQDAGRFHKHTMYFFDNLLLTGLAMCFAIIIVRLLRAE